ncbi:MAG: hypothetical protein ACP5OR_04510 [Candidatus Dormibacteria bacterium]
MANTDTSEHIHMPNNSWIPLSFSLSLAMTLVGIILVPFVWIVGLVWLVTTLIAWARMARKEYLELPDHDTH